MRVALAAVLVAVVFAVPAAPGDAPISAQWRTPAEQAEYEATPSLDETVSFLQRLDRALPSVHLTSFGTSPQGRPLPLVVLSAAGAFTPDAARASGATVVLIQSGIHAGEIDGKDATLSLLRDVALGGRPEMLRAGVVLFVPVFNVDGHERVSPYHRPNQDGPRTGMGFRATAAGHDLNRDWLKLQSPEARAMAALVNAWRPHLHVDIHVTDGVDHDWVLTTSHAEAPQAPAPVDAWMTDHLPAVFAATEAAGHRCGPYVDLLDRNDPAQGFSSVIGGARYSTGYFPLRNRPSLLVEMHSYKPYRKRVEAVREFLAALLAEVARDPRSLVAAVTAAEARAEALGRPDAAPSEVVLDWRDAPADRVVFPVYANATATSTVTGQPMLRYRRGEVRAVEVPWVHRVEPSVTTPRPRGYLVLPGWPQIDERLAGHGLRVERLPVPVHMEVESLWASSPRYASRPYQGLTRVEATIERRAQRRTIPAGSSWIPADQPDFEVAAQMLEPACPESLFAWGFLSTVLEQKEYIDGRNLEDIAARMLADPSVRAAWDAALADPSFASDARARLQWWYRRTPFHAVQEIGMLPVLRVMRGVPPLAGGGPAGE
ncbi:MAG: M14 family metallopeptidase [Acidobacteriota bacterium]